MVDENQEQDANQLTAGQRLAQRKAQKAQSKIEARGRETEKLEARAEEVFESGQDFLVEHKKVIALSVVGILLLVVGVWGAMSYLKNQRVLAGADLWSAVEARLTSVASDDAESSEAQAGAEELSFASEAAKLADIKKLDATAAAHDNVAGDWAKLLSATQANESGDSKAAQASFKSLMDSDDPYIRYRAAEGMGFIAEQNDAWVEAEAQYKELANASSMYAVVGKLHLGRILLHQDKQEQGIATLKEVVELFSDEGSMDENTKQTFVDVEGEARALLTLAGVNLDEEEAEGAEE